jgi:hypothetical protein
MASNVIVNKWLDLADRVGWTAVQAAAGALVAYLATDDFTWEQAAAVVATAAVVAAAKVLVGQRVNDGTGSLVGQPVVEAEPALPVKTTTTTRTR